MCTTPRRRAPERRARCTVGEIAASDTSGPAGERTERLSAEQRRSSLLDVALEVLLAGGESAITIGSVAERANVTRALVYKHFDNREDLIAELHRRERKRLDDELVAVTVNASGGFEAKLRAMVRALLDATDQWGTIFNPLRRLAGPAARRDSRERARRTVDYFARLAVEDYGLPPDTTRAAIRVLLGGLDPLMWQVPRSAGPAQRDALTDLYVSLVVDALAGLARRSSSVPGG